MSLVRIPDDFTVWAFADPHGVRSGVAAALRAAGLVDETEHWIASPGTALVGCGDYVDRGTASAALLDLLFGLAVEAAAAGSLVVLCRGNHEAMIESIFAGNAGNAATWLSDFGGGAATATSLGLAAAQRFLGRPVGALAAALRAVAPGLSDRLTAMPDAAIWRDVLFCHAGPVANLTPDLLGPASSEHLWQFPAFDRADLAEWNLASSLYDGYRGAGIERFVFGHESYAGPTIFQGGRALSLDTNATGGAPGIAHGSVTLAHIPVTGSLAGAACVVIDIADAPDRPSR